MIETLRSLAENAGITMPPVPPPPALVPAVIEKREDDPGGLPGTSLENPRTPLDRIFQIEQSWTGVPVTEIGSLQLAAVWRCVSLIAGAVARTPLLPYRRTDQGRQLARDHYLWPLLTLQANPFMTAYRFQRLMQTWLCLWGNAYAEIEISGRGQVVGLWPWRPDRVQMSGSGEELIYTYYMNDGTRVSLPRLMVLHIRGLETDGVKGLSPIMSARQSIGLTLAAEEYGARFFSNNGKPGGWIEHPAHLGPTAKQNIRETFEDLHRGLRGAHRIGILEEGMKYHDVGAPPEDMQFLQTRQFQAIDIARLFGVPPHKIAELERATFSNIEHQAIEFVNDSLDDWFVNWEAELTCGLLSPREAAQLELLFYRQRLLKGDMKSRYEAYAIARMWGVMSVNDWREEEGQNRVDGPDGDTRLQPLNYEVVGADVVAPIDPENPDADDDVDEPAPVPAGTGD